MPAAKEIAQKTTKGHWPKGKRRNSPRGWHLLLERLKNYIAQRDTANATARAIGVSPRTLHRWLSGQHVANEAAAAQIRQLLASVKW